MPEFDGNIIIKAGIDTQGIDDGIKDVNKKVGAITEAIKAQMSVIDKLKARYDAISKGIIATTEEADLTKRINSENKKLQNLKLTLKQLEADRKFLEKNIGLKYLDEQGIKNFEKLKDNIKTTNAEIKSTTSNIEKLKTSLATIKANPELSKEAINLSKSIAIEQSNLLELQKNKQQLQSTPIQKLQSTPIAPKESNFGKGIIDSVRNISQAISKSSAGIRSFFNDIVSGAGRAVSVGLRPLSRAFSALTAPIRSIGDSISSLVKRGMRIGSFVFVFQILRRALYGVRDVFSMCAKSSGVFSNSLNAIKSNLLTAFYPIYEKIIPILNVFMKYLAGATEYMARFVAMLFGKTLKQSQAGASKLYSTMQSFGGAGGSGGAIDDDTKAKNKNKAATDALGKSEDKLLKKRRAGKAELFSFDKLIVLYTQNEEKLKKAKEKSAGKDNLGFSFVPTSDLAIGGEDIFSQYFKKFEKISESFKGLSDSFKTKVGGFGKRLIEDLRNEYTAPLGDYITQSFIPRILDTTKDLIDGINWDRLNDSLKGLFQALEPFTEHVGDGLVWFYREALVPLGQWTMNKLVPDFVDLLTASLKAFDKVYPGFKSSIEWMFDNLIKPPVEAAGKWLTDMLEGNTKALNEFSDTVDEKKAKNIGAEFGDMLGGVGAGVLTGTGLNLTGKLVTSIIASIAALNPVALTASLAVLAISLAVGSMTKEWITANRSIDEFVKSLDGLNPEEIKEKLGSEEYTDLLDKLSSVDQDKLNARIAALGQNNEDVLKLLKKSNDGLNKEERKWNNEYQTQLETDNEESRKKVRENLETFKTKTKEFFGNFLKDCGKFAENTKEKFTTVGSTIVKGATTMWSEWSKTWNETILPKIKEKFGDAKTALVNTWNEKIIPAFQTSASKIGEFFGSTFKWVINGAIGNAEKAINWMIRRINTVIGWIRHLPGLGWVGDVQEIQIPRLAQGAVLRGGNPFLAYINDQPRGQTNIETPLSTMVQAFDTALKRNNVANTPSNITIEASGDISQIISMLRFKLRQEDQRIGNSFVTGDVWI